jgi:hypothetical protein
MGVAEDCAFLLGYRPWYPEGHPLRYRGIPVRGVKMLVIAEDWETVRDIFTNDAGGDANGMFFKFLPVEAIVKKSRNGSTISQIIVESTVKGVKRVSSVTFDTVVSYKINPRSFESKDWDVIHVDEPIPEDLWKAVSRGLISRGGKFWWLFTPLCFPWMYEFITTQAKEDPASYWWFQATMEDNPTLDAKRRADYLATLPPDELACRLNGIPLSRGRRVYGLFDEARHVWVSGDFPPGWRDERTPPYSWACGYAIDPHPKTPHAVLFTAISPQGDFFIFDEFFSHVPIKELARAINHKLRRLRVCWQLCDKFAWNEDCDTGRTWADALWEEGLQVQPGSKRLQEGLMRTQEIWSPNARHKVYVMPHCREFLREIRLYSFDKEDKPVDKDDHMMECLYRTVLHTELRFQPLIRSTEPTHELAAEASRLYNPSLSLSMEFAN